MKGMCNIYVSVCIYPTHLQLTRCNTRSIFKQSKAGLNSEFFFPQTGCLTKAKEPNLPYYLPIVGGRKDGFMPLCCKKIMDFYTRKHTHIRTHTNRYVYIYIYIYTWSIQEIITLIIFSREVDERECKYLRV